MAQQSEWDISIQEFRSLRESGEDFVLVDVREHREVEVVNLGGRHIPLGELPARMDELAREERIVVHCKVGGRSARAVALLREAGFGNAWNLNGGIIAWIEQVDPSLPKY